MSSEPRLHLAVALKDTGWHPAAWRLPGAATHELFTAGYWTRLMTEAEAGTLDFVTVELQVGGRHVAVVDTILEPEQEAEAHTLAREIARGLESGELEPTAGALERLPSVA